MKRNRNSHASGKRSQHCCQNTQSAMQIDAAPNHKAHLNEKQHEPERKNQSVEVQKQRERGSAE